MKELRDEISELSRDSKRDAEKCQQELTILGNAADKLKAEWHAPPFEVEWVKTHGCMECGLFYLDDCSFAKGSPSCLKKRSEHANGTS